jgi:hypothetical protein
VQFIDPPHDREIVWRNRAGFVVESATADTQDLCLLDDWQIVRGRDHRFALGMPALPSAPDKNV